VFGLYKRPNGSNLPEWTAETGTKTADDFLKTNPRAFRNLDPNDPRYRGFPQWVAAFDKAVKDGIPVHFDLSGLDIKKALTGPSAVRSVTSGELQWLRRNWSDFKNLASKPRFWLDGQEVKPPWEWPNPATPVLVNTH
jgi:hypothetical protein